MILIYVNIEDLKPKKDETLEWGEQAFGKEVLEKWEKSMREDGFKKEKLLLVDWRGAIIDGNIRYHLAKKIGIKYLPIDYNFLVRDLNSFVHTQAFKWNDRAKLETKEMQELDEQMNLLLPHLKKTDEKEKADILNQLTHQILSQREK